VKYSLIAEFSSDACRIDIAAAPTMIVSTIRVNLFFLLAIVTAAITTAQANIRQGETALWSNAPAQRAPPKARAR
jgi:hypothetical protein